MTWADFYLICFVVGFAFSFLSFVAGGLRWHVPQFPHGLGHGGHIGVGHAPTVGGHGPAAPAPPDAVGAHGTPHAAHKGHASPFNFATLAAFLAWFGGAGYLLTRYSSVVAVLGIAFATLSGLFGGGIIFLFMTKVLMSENENMDPADFEMVGVLGKICSSIREGGTGEIIYSQAGTRRTCGARAEDGTAIAKGEEIVVTRYEKGIAYVRRWEEMTAESDGLGTASGRQQP